LLKHINIKVAKPMIKRLTLSVLVIIPILLSSIGIASADITCSGGKVSGAASGQPQYCCGSTSQHAVATSIDLGCQGKGSPLADMLFAIIRILSDGVGLVVIASMVVAGIQFTSSRGDPQASAQAMKRIQSNVTALILFFFAYAILNYLVPGQVL
jgi:hypothetical protein